MNSLRKNILNTLTYFDLFHYPITRCELLHFSHEKTTLSSIDNELCSLVYEKIIFQLDEFYSLQNELSLSERRRKGNLRSINQIIIARRIARILYYCPFVLSIAVSGSLSKHFAEDNSDIDFFIITSANRLWIARTFMHVFKKLSYIAGKQDWFCMNYYVDELAMEIPEKNIFTAMEIVTLLPMQGMDCFQKFKESNSWTFDYFPLLNHTSKSIQKSKKIIFRTFFEKILSSSLGNKMEQWLRQLTDQRWKKKTISGKVNEHGEKMEMIAGAHFSKPNPNNFQTKVLQRYENGIMELANQKKVIPVN